MSRLRYLNLILGDQLDAESQLFDNFDPQHDRLWMAEVSAESTEYLSSKQRTVLFLSAMRHFAEKLKTDNYPLIYWTLSDKKSSFPDALSATLKHDSFKKIRCVLPGDVRVMNEIQQCANDVDIEIEWLADQHFISEKGEFKAWLADRKQPRMEFWYRQLRKSRQILMEDDQPLGGQWNFDKDNRKSFGKKGPSKLPEPLLFEANDITKQVITDVEKFLPDLYGNIETFNWPVSREQSLAALNDFIQHRLPHFGDYQDAMWTDEPWLYHSRLSTCLNLKLLSPAEVIAAAEKAYTDNKAPLNAVEGFIRQILGWREYVRGLYWSYRDDWLQMNALNARRKLPALYWNAETEMTCLHHSVKQVLDHHQLVE